jgi:DNA-binding SARP family transcriptional activator
MAAASRTLGEPMRIYLTGQLAVELNTRLLPASSLRGRQSRRVFAYLVCERERPLPRPELAEAIWSEALPDAWEAALSALVSRLRGALAPGATVAGGSSGYQLRLPPDAWVDLEAATQAIDQAETALRRAEPRSAFGPAAVAVSIARRPCLPAENGAWIERQRTRLRGILLRGLDCLAQVWLANGEGALALQAAEEALSLEPFRETGYQRLMQVHAALGNRSEAIRVYGRCRLLLADELGVDPSPQTEALYLKLLGPP